MLHTTLNLLKENYACRDGYRTLCKSLPKDFDKDKKIELSYILGVCGFEDAIWSLRATTENSLQLMRELALWNAEQVLPIYEGEYPNDSRVRNCIAVTKQYSRGEASKSELESAAADVLAAAAYAVASATYAATTTAYAAAAYVAVLAAPTVVTAIASAAYAATTAEEVAAADFRGNQKAKFLEMLEAR